jgi:hypothetical protein
LERNRKREEKSGYFGSIIVSVIFYYIVNNLLNWHIYFITSAFNEVLWIINLSILVTIVGNALLLIYSPVRFLHIVKLIINIISFIAVYTVYKVFPFNFYNSFYNWGFNILLILALIGIIIAIIIEIYLLIIGKRKIIGK